MGTYDWRFVVTVDGKRLRPYERPAEDAATFRRRGDVVFNRTMLSDGTEIGAIACSDVPVPPCTRGRPGDLSMDKPGFNRRNQLVDAAAWGTRDGALPLAIVGVVAVAILMWRRHVLGVVLAAAAVGISLVVGTPSAVYLVVGLAALIWCALALLGWTQGPDDDRKVKELEL